MRVGGGERGEGGETEADRRLQNALLMFPCVSGLILGVVHV